MNEENYQAISVPAGAQTTALAAFAAMTADFNRVKKVLAANMGTTGLSEFDLQRIKVPSGGGLVYELASPDGVTVAQKFRAIILFARDSRGYWPKSLDETGGVPPDCHSNDLVVGIGSPGGRCATCVHAQFGSATKGKGQACKQTKHLFLMREGRGKVYLPEILSIPPTSLQTYRKFTLELSNAGAFVSGVVTEFSLVKVDRAGATSYSAVVFRAATPLTDDEAGVVEAYGDYVSQLLPVSSPVPPPANQGDTGDPAFD